MHPTRHDEAYRALRQELQGLGLFEPDALGYALHCAWVLPCYAACWWALLGGHALWARVALAALAAFTMMQGAALGHEAGHGAVSRRAWVNRLTGSFWMSFGAGNSQASWDAMHSAHHRHANSGGDPNLRSRLFSFTEVDARQARGLKRWITRHQALLFWPLITLMGAAFRLGSLQHMLANPRTTRGDQALVLLHHLVWLALPAALAGAGIALVNYLLVLWFCGVYLAAIFVANHLGHPAGAAAWQASFLGRQAANARNLPDSWLLRRFCIGLNSHIEHHLFPRISFTRLHRARAATRRCCERLGVPYHEVGIVAALRELHRHNRRMAELAARRLNAAAGTPASALSLPATPPP